MVPSPTISISWFYVVLFKNLRLPFLMDFKRLKQKRQKETIHQQNRFIMKKSLLLIALLQLFIGCEKKQSNDNNKSGWTLVYKHDKQGNAVYGTKQKLIEAIQNGLSVRVGYGRQIQEDRSLEHLADAQFLTILKIEGQHNVFAQISPIMRQDPFRQNDSIAINMVPEFMWRTTIGTNGISSNAMVNVFKDSLNGSNNNRRGAMWFVEYPPNFDPTNTTLTIE